MLLHRIRLNPRCREARRDLADPYQLHSTLCRAFAPPETRLAPGSVLWRLESGTDSQAYPRVLVQSRSPAEWGRINIDGWLADAEPSVDLMASARLGLGSLHDGQQFRFRLRANPCVTRNGKRLGLLRLEEQESWLMRKGVQHGFSLPTISHTEQSRIPRPDIRISQEQMLGGRQHGGNGIRIFSVLYDGILTVTDAELFLAGLRSGIGHGKALGLGLLSIAPIGLRDMYHG